MIRSSQIIAVGGLILVTKIWIDACKIWKHQIKLNTYAKISSCVLDVLTIVKEESDKRSRSTKRKF